MKKFTLFVLCLCAGLTFASQAQNANNPARGGMPAFIDASIENLDFGDLEVGYSQFRTFTVSGDFLVDDIYLTLEGQGMSAYQVSPATLRAFRYAWFASQHHNIANPLTSGCPARMPRMSSFRLVPTLIFLMDSLWISRLKSSLLPLVDCRFVRAMFGFLMSD